MLVLAGESCMSTEPTEIERELAAVLNKYSAEVVSGTPDFILARYVTDCLKSFNEAVSHRAEWRGEPIGFRGFSATPEPKTPEEKRAFEKDWDSKVVPSPGGSDNSAIANGRMYPSIIGTVKKDS